ncbi:MAG: vitamin B12 dependent-methionine synthase activation domain-containing protein [Caldilineaceae bacterium]
MIVRGERAPCFADAQAILDKLIAEEPLLAPNGHDAPAGMTANAVVGFFPANSVGDDIELCGRKPHPGPHPLPHAASANRHRQRRWPWPISSPQSGVADYMGCFAVCGRWRTVARAFADQHDDYHAILVKALADRLAEEPWPR